MPCDVYHIYTFIIIIGIFLGLWFHDSTCILLLAECKCLHIKFHAEIVGVTLTSGWSGATPNLTSPKGTGNFSRMSTLAAGWPWNQDVKYQNYSQLK